MSGRSGGWCSAFSFFLFSSSLSCCRCVDARELFVFFPVAGYLCLFFFFFSFCMACRRSPSPVFFSLLAGWQRATDDTDAGAFFFLFFSPPLRMDAAKGEPMFSFFFFLSFGACGRDRAALRSTASFSPSLTALPYALTSFPPSAHEMSGRFFFPPRPSSQAQCDHPAPFFLLREAPPSWPFGEYFPFFLFLPPYSDSTPARVSSFPFCPSSGGGGGKTSSGSSFLFPTSSHVTKELSLLPPLFLAESRAWSFFSPPFLSAVIGRRRPRLLFFFFLAGAEPLGAPRHIPLSFSPRGRRCAGMTKIAPLSHLVSPPPPPFSFPFENEARREIRRCVSPFFDNVVKTPAVLFLLLRRYSDNFFFFSRL